MLKSVAMAIAALVITAPASAQNAAAGQPASVQKAKDPNRIICEREEEVGSRLGGKKVCMTAREWDEQRAQHRDALETLQRQNTSNGMPSGGI